MFISKPECANTQETYTLTGEKNNKEYTVCTLRSNHGNKLGLIDQPEHEGLVGEITKTYLGTYPQRNPEISKLRVKRSLNYPRTIAELVYCEDQLVGVGIFPRFNYDAGITIYTSRFFLSEHTGEGLGTRIIENAISLHQQELDSQHRSLRWLAFMTMNPYTLESIWKLPMVGESWPISYQDIEGQRVAKLNYYKQGGLPQRVMLRTYNDHYMSSLSLNTHTGVSKGELIELGMNESYRPNPGQKLAWQVHKFMVTPYPYGLEMNREAGDEMYMVCEIIK